MSVKEMRGFQHGGKNIRAKVEREGQSYGGRDVFVFANGLKIAKRGYPNTPQAGTWVSLEPGWEVVSSPEFTELAISHGGVRVH